MPATNSALADNSIATAQSLRMISPQTTIQGTVGRSDLTDFYRFSISSRSRVELSLDGRGSNPSLQLIQDRNLNRSIDRGDLVIKAPNSSGIKIITTILNPGTYYIQVSTTSSARDALYKVTSRVVKTGQSNTDVNGDGRDDAIAIRREQISVALSNGSQFIPSQPWTQQAHVGNKDTFFADVNGDGRADAIAISDNSPILIRLSEGNKFSNVSQAWTQTAFFGDRGTYVADVNGDGRADIIAINNQTHVTVRLSTGSAFAAPTQWTNYFLGGDRATFFADVNGDGKADAIGINSGDLFEAGIWVRLSTGSSFATMQRWYDKSFVGDKGTFVADVNGDGKADIIGINSGRLYAEGAWVKFSTGKGFTAQQKLTSNFFWGDRGTSVADVNGDGKADLIGVNSGQRWETGVWTKLSKGSSFGANQKLYGSFFSGDLGTIIGTEIQDIRFDTPVSSSEWRASLFSYYPEKYPQGTPITFANQGTNTLDYIGDINLGSSNRSDGKPGISFNWRNDHANHDIRLPQDYFAISAYTSTSFDGGTYKFQVKSDDGFQLLAKRHDTQEWFYITSQTEWSNSYNDYQTITATLPAGVYDVGFRYFDITGAAYFDLSWEKIVSSSTLSIPVDWNASSFRSSNIFWPNFAPPSAGGSLDAPGNCTWYVNGRLQQLGYSSAVLNKMFGNAYEWDDQAAAAGARIVNTPSVGTIAQWESNHVAVVEQVNEDGSIVISESSYYWLGGSSYLYNTRTIQPGNDWPTRFIEVPRA